MSSFILYDIIKDDIENQYALGNTLTLNQPNNCIFNLEIIEGVNELQLENGYGYVPQYRYIYKYVDMIGDESEGEGDVLIGYTPISDNGSNLYYAFLKNSASSYVNFVLNSKDNNLLKIPKNTKINKIIFTNIKGGIIPNDILQKCKIFISSSYRSQYILNNINFSEFNNNVEGNLNFSTKDDDSYIFLFTGSPYSSLITEKYQLQIKIYYSI